MYGRTVATQLVYLVTGIDTVLQTHRVRVRLTGEDEDHPITAGSGHIGMVDDMYPYAEAVVAYIDSRMDQDFPGVFEYEVTETLGTWLANNWTDEEPPTLASFNAELERQGDAFFAQ